MNASKENATKALAHSRKGTGQNFIQEFLEAAQRKLPSEGAYAKAEQRLAEIRRNRKPVE